MAPQPIEGMLKDEPPTSPSWRWWGDGKPYLSALVAPDFEQLERWCEGEGVPTGSHEAMAADERVREHLLAEIRRLSGDLASFEQVKKIAVLATTFSIEGGELTPTLKVKRRVVEQRYADLIESLYA